MNYVIINIEGRYVEALDKKGAVFTSALEEAKCFDWLSSEQEIVHNEDLRGCRKISLWDLAVEFENELRIEKKTN